MIELPVDRSIYAVDRASRTYRYARRNLYWDQLDPAVDEENKRSLDGYVRIFPDGRTRVFTYRPPHDGRQPPAPARAPVAIGLPVAALGRAVRAFVHEVEGLPDATDSEPNARWSGLSRRDQYEGRHERGDEGRSPAGSSLPPVARDGSAMIAHGDRGENDGADRGVCGRQPSARARHPAARCR